MQVTPELQNSLLLALKVSVNNSSLKAFCLFDHFNAVCFQEAPYQSPLLFLSFPFFSLILLLDPCSEGRWPQCRELEGKVFLEWPSLTPRAPLVGLRS